MSDKMTKPIPAIKTADPETAEEMIQPYRVQFNAMVHNIVISQAPEYLGQPTTENTDEWSERHHDLWCETVDRMKYAFARWFHELNHDEKNWAKRMFRDQARESGVPTNEEA